ncbi:MAG TPA: hypothetical protein VGL61_26040 [Kofleriaceae bacterium]
MPAIVASHRSELERYYTCPRCGARGEAKLVAVGRSVWGGAFVIHFLVNLMQLRRVDVASAGNAQDQAEEHAQRDADRMLALMRCPSCHKRPLMTFVWPLVRVAGYALLGALVTLALLMFGLHLPAELGAAAFGAYAVVVEIGRFSRVRRTVALKMTPRAELEGAD